MPQFDFSYDKEFNLLLDGFDVKIMPSDKGPEYLWVTLIENGGEAFQDDISIPETKEDEKPEDTLQNAAQVAIDLFEASRGTLGMGAGAADMKSANKQASLWSVGLDEEWFMSFKGTPFEDQAYDLLSNQYELDLEMATAEDSSVDISRRISKLDFELSMLNLERLRCAAANTKIIIVQAKLATGRTACEAEIVSAFLDKFTGSAQEPKVVKLLKEYLSLKDQLSKFDESMQDFWARSSELASKKDNLSMEALQINIDKKMPTSGLDSFPNMGNAIADLMKGVTMDEELMPMFASKKALEENGDFHDGLDPAEIPVDDRKFEVGDKVSLSKKFDSMNAGGVATSFDKGSKGVVENLYDGHGDCVVVGFDDGGSVIVPVGYLK
jgi:hypothetical protein